MKLILMIKKKNIYLYFILKNDNPPTIANKYFDSIGLSKFKFIAQAIIDISNKTF